MSSLLEISLLGGIAIKRDGIPVTGFGWRKAEALVAYLACNRRAHSRQVLAGLLWEEQEEAQAMSNLRSVLKNLRRLLGEHIIIDRQNVTFNTELPFRLDVIELEKSLKIVTKLKGSSPGNLAEAVASQVEAGLALYQGEFLKGFFLRECATFEEWMLSEQERLQQLVIEGLNLLVKYRLYAQQYTEGIRQVSHLLQLDPLREEAHQELMVLLSMTGQKSAALNHYKTYQRYLASELDIAPEAKTSDLYELIRTGKLEAAMLRGDTILASPTATSGYWPSTKPNFTSKFARLKRVSLFLETSDEVLKEVEALMEEKEIKAGKIIFEKGDQGDTMYIIVKGKVRVQDGKRIINDLGEQDIFGEMAVLDKAPRLATVTTLEDTSLLSLSQAALYGLMASRIEVVQGIIKVLSSRLRDRVRDVVELESHLQELSSQANEG